MSIFYYPACLTDGETEAVQSEMICQRSSRLKSPETPEHCFILSAYSAKCVAMQWCCSNQARLIVPR